MLDKGAEVDRAEYKFGATSLYIACQNCHVDTARLLLDKGADVNRANTNNETPLYIACQQGNVDVARLVLGKGADMNQERNDGTMPLHVACENGHVDAARLLLDKGVEVDQAVSERWKKKGLTPLSIAKSKGHSSIVALLEEHKSSKSRGAAES